MSSRAVRQRKLNTKQHLRIIRENEIDDAPDQELGGHIPQVETGVEKGEEVEFHLQAVINGALGATIKQNYIPTPDAVWAKDVKYDELYPKEFKEPATYIRFSSTVEDCVGTPYCMNEDDAKFLEQLNEGKDVDGKPLKDKSHQCSEDTFEEVMSFFEESVQRLQPFANLDTAPTLSLEEMQQSREEPLSPEAERWLKQVYRYWQSRKGTRSMMPAIKVRVLDTTSTEDDADPYVCFRRREVRQTRKTRGRDAQVVEKLKKLRIELEQARQLVLMTVQREDFQRQNLEISRKVFEQRKQLKDVKIAKNIIGEKGEDEELLVNQRPMPKPKSRSDQQRGPTIRLPAARGDRPPEHDLTALSDVQADAEAQVQHVIDSRKEQHRGWNRDWQDRTWNPLTPPPETADDSPKWAPLFQDGTGYPTPPPSLPSRSSQDADGDVEMADQKPPEDEGITAEPEFTFFVPPPYPVDGLYTADDFNKASFKRNGNPACRIRYGRGGRAHLEIRKSKPKGMISRGVVSDSDSDEEIEDYHPVSDVKTFDYRCALNSRARPDGGDRRHWPSGDQSAMMAGAQGAATAPMATGHSQAPQNQQPAGGTAG